MKQLIIRFYDDCYQEEIEGIPLKNGNILNIAERCLNEALRRCRKAKMVEMEPNILLALAEFMAKKIKKGRKDINEELVPYLRDAKEIAERAGYRLQLVDIHLFCGEVLLEMPGKKLLGSTAKEHLQLAKEFAKDVSTFEDLYQSQDPHFYDGILEYEMLKRGMTEQERIENGYYVAYQIAEALEKKLK